MFSSFEKPSGQAGRPQIMRSANKKSRSLRDAVLSLHYSKTLENNQGNGGLSCTKQSHACGILLYGDFAKRHISSPHYLTHKCWGTRLGFCCLAKEILNSQDLPDFKLCNITFWVEFQGAATAPKSENISSQ